MTSLNESHFAAERDRLPAWARSTNPIVRRHLGLYWRTLPPTIRPIAMALGVWIAVILVSIFIPFVFDVASTVLVVSILTVPVIFYYYAHILFTIATVSAPTMGEELRNNTMQLLMATPMSLQQIFLGKAAASIWKRMDDLMLVILAAAVFGTPMIATYYGAIWSLAEFPVTSHIIMILGMLVSIIRLVLEPLMLAMVGVMIGALVPYRSTSITTTIGFGIFYFFFLNLIRHIPAIQANGALVLFVELVLPLLAPILIVWGSLRFTTRMMLKD